MTVATRAAAPAVRLRSAPGRWVLVATILGSAIASIDATVVGIALPVIGRDFHVSMSSLQWVVTAYMLTLAGLLLLGGALGDRYGRRRVFLAGVAVFAASSALCGFAPDVTSLVVARALQGVGGALLTPGSLAILQASFAAEDAGAAIGAWSGLGGVATALGPLIGGWLVQAASWRWIFFLNLPLAVVVTVVGRRHVPETRAPSSGRPLDFAGAALVTAALVATTYALIEGSAAGWRASAVLASLAVALVAFVAFVVRERRAVAPLLPLAVFRNRQLAGTNAVTFVMYGAIGGALFLLPVQLEQVLRYTPIAAGTSLLPVTVVMLLLSSRSGALAARIGPRLQMACGPVVVAAGMLLMARIGAGGSYLRDVAPAVLVLGLGLAATVAPLTATALASAPAEHVGLASAVNNDVARAAALVAVAVLPAAAHLTGDAYLHPATFDHGFHVAVVMAGAACVAAGLLAAATIRNPRRVTAPAAPCRCCPLDAPPPPEPDQLVLRP